MRTPNKDTSLGLGLAAFFGAVLLFVIPRAVVIPSSAVVPSLRPDFWPSILCGVLVLLGLGLAAGSLSGPARPAPESGCGGCAPAPGSDPAPGPTRPARPGRAAPACVAALLAAYAWTLEAAGMIIPSALAFTALALLYGERRPGVLAVVAVGLPVGLYLFFTQVANVPMPAGDLLAGLLAGAQD